MSVGTLDYEPIRIRMHYANPTERNKRLGAVAKEQETVRWIESFEPASVFFDVGANVGSYSLIAAALGHQVVSFEPSLPNAERFRQNFDLNEDLHSILVVDPLWKCREEITFCYSSRQPGAALHEVNGQGPDREVLKAYPLDWWLFSEELPIRLPQPRYVKIDTDGCEPEIIQGAARTLSRVQEIMVEIDEASPSSAQIEPLLNTLQFKMTSRYPHGHSPVSNALFTRA